MEKKRGEDLGFPRFENGRYMPDAYQHFCYLMRDVTDRGRVVSMDIGLLNLLYGAQEWARLVGVSDPYYTANSGYRTPAHNARAEGAARKSLHMTGQARVVDCCRKSVVRQSNKKQCSKEWVNDGA